MSNKELKAVIFEGPGKAVLRNISMPEPEPNDVVFRVEYSGVSMGTEIWYYAGRRMQDISYPAIPGYQAVGIVESVGTNVSGFKPGDRVFARRTRVLKDFDGSWMGSHVSIMVSSVEETIKIDPSIDPKAAVMNALPAVSLHGYNFLNSRPGDTVVVLGQGLIGQMSAQIAKLRGARVITADRFPLRVERSAEFSADLALNSAEVNLTQVVQEYTNGQGADIVIDSTGAASIFSQCVDLVRPKGQILMQGWYGETIPVDGHLTHMKEPTVYFPCSFYPEEQEQCLAWMANGDLRLNGLLTHIVSPEECQQMYDTMLNRPQETLGVLFDWSLV